MSPSDRKPLTPRQAECFAVICAHWVEFLAPPTVRELAKALAMSSHNGVVRHLSELEQKGWVTRAASITRGIEIVGLRAVVDGCAKQFLDTLKGMA